VRVAADRWPLIWSTRLSSSSGACRGQRPQSTDHLVCGLAECLATLWRQVEPGAVQPREPACLQQQWPGERRYGLVRVEVTHDEHFGDGPHRGRRRAVRLLAAVTLPT
jgi:hypothetical protein